MSVADVPGWCRWRGGRRPLLLIAPHGGHADTTTARAASTKVNDVHTAELTWALAEALDAAAIVNPVFDRNRLDLNRISQVTHDAAWFPGLIAALLAPLLDVHATVEVLFIHGWNVIQPKCDIGVGAHFETEADVTHLTQLTADPQYVRARLHELRTRCAAVGVHATYGERYPASHRNNVLQLFRRDGSRSCPAAPRICDWAARGRLNAVQLELGVPLRWPGPPREAFTRALIDTLQGGNLTPPANPPSVGATHASPPPGSPQPAMLVGYDPRAALGFMSAISVQPNGQLGGRLLVFSQGQTMALFTGEDPSRRGTVIGGPQFALRDKGMELLFTGSLLEVRDAAAYVRLELAFMQSRLVEGDLALCFDPTHDDRYGRVYGTVRLDDVTHHIDTFGFRDLPIFLRRSGSAPMRCAVAAAFGGGGGLHAATTEADDMHWVVHGVDGTQTMQARTRIDEARSAASPAPARLTLRSDQRQLLVTPLNHMQIHRPLPNGHSEEIFLGLARCESESRSDGYGFYEYVRRCTGDL